MTVSSTTNRVSYSGNGVTTSFSFPYFFMAQSDLIVTATDSLGVISTEILNTDYTVSGSVATNGTYPSGGSVVMGVAPAAGITLSIIRNPAATQATSFSGNTEETALDKLTLLVQRLLDFSSRAIHLKDGFVATFDPLLPAVMTPNYALAVNNAGTGWTLVQSAAAAGTVTSVGLNLPAEFSVGSAVTSSGNLSATWADETRNKVFAGPTSGSATTPTFRSLVAADIPALALASMSSGLASLGDVPVADGAGGIAWEAVLGTGTVTSVALTLPNIFSVAGSPVTTTGTLAATLASQAKNIIFAGPTSGSNAAPTFRSLVAADLPVMGGASSGSAGALGAVPQPASGQQGYFLRGDATWVSIPAGTVTSVDLAMPAEFSVSGDPVTGSGTLTVTKANQNKNIVFAGPGSGSAAAPTFRSLVAADLPVFVGCTSLASGIAGAVPSPSAGNQSNFLRADGVWSLPTVGVGLGPQSVVAAGNVTLGAVSQSVEVNAGAPCTITLPPAASMLTAAGPSTYAGQVTITNTTTNLATIAGNGGDTIVGSATAKLQFQWSSVTLYPNNAGTGWIIA